MRSHLRTDKAGQVPNKKMENFYHLVVALTNGAAYIPLVFARAHNKRLDSAVVAAAAVCSLFYHASLAVAPQYSAELLWCDRVAAIVAVIHFLYFFAATCPCDIERGFHATRVMGGVGLVSLFISDVLLAKKPTLVWCILHGVWHICAFFTVRKLQNFIYRAGQK